jgi:hypothetical protein
MTIFFFSSKTIDLYSTNKRLHHGTVPFRLLHDFTDLSFLVARGGLIASLQYITIIIAYFDLVSLQRDGFRCCKRAAATPESTSPTPYPPLSVPVPIVRT